VIRCEHFIYAHQRGLVMSAGVEQLLTKKSLKHLCGLNGESTIQTWLPEGLIAITHLHHGRDSYGRKTVWNHTILVSPEDFFSFNPPDKFKQYFITELPKRQTGLQPLKIGR